MTIAASSCITITTAAAVSWYQIDAHIRAANGWLSEGQRLFPQGETNLQAKDAASRLLGINEREAGKGELVLQPRTFSGPEQVRIQWNGVAPTLQVSRPVGASAHGESQMLTASLPLGTDLVVLGSLFGGWSLVLMWVVWRQRSVLRRKLSQPLMCLDEALKVAHAAQRHQADADLLLANVARSGLQDVDNLIEHILNLSRQVREEHENVQHWAARSHTDRLTGMPNRDALEFTYQSYGRENTKGVLIYCDVRGIAKVNQESGFKDGDFILRSAAQHLQRIASDAGGVGARVAGDRFVLLLPGASKLTAEKRANEISTSHQFHKIVCSTVTFAARHDDLADLLSRAEILSAHAKDAASMDSVWSGLDIERAVRLQRALLSEFGDRDRDEHLQLHYQPVVELRARRTAYFEALLRIRNPVTGQVGSGYQLVLAAERKNSIRHLDLWVLRQAMAALTTHPWLTVAVNMSALTVSDRDAADDIRRIISGGDGRRLIVELTETASLQDNFAARSLMSELNALGVKISLDDFGAGYSTFTAILEYPISTVKIDGQLTQKGRLDSATGRAIEAICSIASERKIDVVAEWVGDDVTAAWLSRLGVMFGQGHLFGLAAPLDEQEPVPMEPASVLELPQSLDTKRY